MTALPGSLTQTAICVPAYGSAGLLRDCLDSIDRHTPETVPIIILDDHSDDDSVAEVIHSFLRDTARPWQALSHRSNVGFVEAANELLDLASPLNVALVNADVVVTPRWLDELCALLDAVPSTATVTSVTNCGTLASVPDLEALLPRMIEEGFSIEEHLNQGSAAAVAIPTAVGHCMLIARDALDLVGSFDPEFSPGYGEEVDFSQRCTAVGMGHLLATNSLVFHHGSGSFGTASAVTSMKFEHEAIVKSRYPSYPQAVMDSERQGILGRWESKRIADLRAIVIDLRGLIVGMDARMIGDQITGTSRVALELIRELSQDRRIYSLKIYCNAVGQEQIARAISDARVGVSMQHAPFDYVPSTHECDIVIRPCQLFSPDELPLLRSAAPRWHLHVLDGLAYDNCTYFADPEHWRQYRRLFEWSVYHSDSLSVNSQFVRNWLQLAGLGRECLVLGNGVNCLAPTPDWDASRAWAPGELLRLLQVGTSFAHKNRPFSIRVAAAIAEMGTPVELTFVGPDPDYGSTREEEIHLYRRVVGQFSGSPHAGVRVVWKGALSDSDLVKVWRRSHVALYPSVSEGFGLIPFESALLGVPCVSSGGGSLGDLVPASSRVDSFDAEEWAAAVVAAATAPGSRKNVDGLRNGASGLAWGTVADALVHQLRGCVTARGASYLDAFGSLDTFQAWASSGRTIDSRIVVESPSPEAAAPLEGRVIALESENAELAAALHQIYSSRRWRWLSRCLRVLGK